MEEVKTDLIPKWNEIREQGGKIIIASGDHHNRSDRHRASEEALAIRSMFPKPEEGGSHKENIEVITGEGSGGGFETTSKGSDIFVSHAVSGGRYDAAQNAISHFENIKREYARLNVSGDDHKLAGGSVYKGTDEDGNPEFMKILRNAGAQPSINLLPKIGALDSPRGFIRAYDDEEHGYTEYHPVLDEQLTSRALGIFMDEGR